MRDYENPTHVPRLPLKIIAIAYIMWFVVVPSVAFARAGQFQILPVSITGGLALIPVGLGVLFLHRLILWFHYTFFWYLTAFFAIISALCAGTFAVGIFTFPTSSSVTVSAAMQSVIEALTIPGAILGIIALIIIFKPGSRPAAPVPVTPPAPAKPTPVDHAEAILERRRKLGLDK